LPTSSDLDLADAKSLGTLTAGADLKFDGLTFVKAAVTLALNVGVVDEDVFSVSDGEESIALFGIKEFYGAIRHYSVSLSFETFEKTRT
jgi:hypothetical protein